jgi:hypothetical protein
MLKNIVIFVAGVLVAGLVLGVVGYAYAQTQPQATPSADQPQGLFGGGMMRGGRGGGMMGRQGRGEGAMDTYIQEAWAKALGVSVEDLTTRLNNGEALWQIAAEKGFDTTQELVDLNTQVHKDALAAAVAAGVLTQAQADAITQRMQLDADDAGGRFGMGFGRGMGLLGTYQQEAWAKALGVTVDDLTTRLNNGEALWQIAAEKGFDTTQEFVELHTQVHTDALAAAVAAGEITQAQADAMTQRMQDGPGFGFGLGKGYGNGFGMGFDRGFGHGFGCPAAPAATPAP